MTKPPTLFNFKFHGGGIAEFSLKSRPLFFQSVCDSSGLNYLCGRIYTLIIKKQRNMEKRNMEISNSTKAYKTPQVKVLEVKVQGVLCGSLNGTPSNSPWTPGSDSNYGFGDED